MDVTLQVRPETALDAGEKIELEWLRQEYAQLLEQKKALEVRVRKSEERRRALMHILQDAHQSNLRLENSRKAMIHIMSDLRETTAEVQRREHELREKQE